VKRREPLNLAHVFEDRRPAPLALPPIEKRIHTRFDKAFLVVIESELYGDTVAVARNVSAGGILVEMSYAPPLGTQVTVHFQYARDDDQLDEIMVRAEVKHHHYLNFAGGNDASSARAIGLRFVEFVAPDERIPPERWH
jgi:PilZ domain-containing protein